MYIRLENPDRIATFSELQWQDCTRQIQYILLLCLKHQTSPTIYDSFQLSSLSYRETWHDFENDSPSSLAELESELELLSSPFLCSKCRLNSSFPRITGRNSLYTMLCQMAMTTRRVSWYRRSPVHRGLSFFNSFSSLLCRRMKTVCSDVRPGCSFVRASSPVHA